MSKSSYADSESDSSGSSCSLNATANTLTPADLLSRARAAAALSHTLSSTFHRSAAAARAARARASELVPAAETLRSALAAHVAALSDDAAANARDAPAFPYSKRPRERGDGDCLGDVAAGYAVTVRRVAEAERSVQALEARLEARFRKIRRERGATVSMVRRQGEQQQQQQQHHALQNSNTSNSNALALQHQDRQQQQQRQQLEQEPGGLLSVFSSEMQGLERAAVSSTARRRAAREQRRLDRETHRREKAQRKRDRDAAKAKAGNDDDVGGVTVSSGNALHPHLSLSSFTFSDSDTDFSPVSGSSSGSGSDDPAVHNSELDQQRLGLDESEALRTTSHSNNSSTTINTSAIVQADHHNHRHNHHHRHSHHHSYNLSVAAPSTTMATELGSIFSALSSTLPRVSALHARLDAIAAAAAALARARSADSAAMVTAVAALEAARRERVMALARDHGHGYDNAVAVAAGGLRRPATASASAATVAATAALSRPSTSAAIARNSNATRLSNATANASVSASGTGGGRVRGSGSAAVARSGVATAGGVATATVSTVTNDESSMFFNRSRRNNNSNNADAFDTAASNVAACYEPQSQYVDISSSNAAAAVFITEVPSFNLTNTHTLTSPRSQTGGLQSPLQSPFQSPTHALSNPTHASANPAATTVITANAVLASAAAINSGSSTIVPDVAAVVGTYMAAPPLDRLRMGAPVPAPFLPPAAPPAAAAALRPRTALYSGRTGAAGDAAGVAVGGAAQTDLNAALVRSLATTKRLNNNNSSASGSYGVAGGHTPGSAGYLHPNAAATGGGNFSGVMAISGNFQVELEQRKRAAIAHNTRNTVGRPATARAPSSSASSGGGMTANRQAGTVSFDTITDGEQYHRGMLFGNSSNATDTAAAASTGATQQQPQQRLFQRPRTSTGSTRPTTANPSQNREWMAPAPLSESALTADVVAAYRRAQGKGIAHVMFHQHGHTHTK